MDRSQLLLEKKDFPRTENYRFSIVMKYFSLISLISITFFTILNAILNIWPMVLICSFCIALWLGITLIKKRGMIQIAFLAGILNTTVFTLLSTWFFGWGSGFFFLALLMIPIIFQNSKLNLVWRYCLTCAILIVMIGLFILSWGQSSYWIIGEGLLRFLLITNLFITVVVSAITSLFIARTVTDAENALINSNKKLTGLATTDPVTNLVNRRIILSRIEQEKIRMERGSKPFALIMVDIDNFQQVNDEFGHNGGDFVLINLAELISITLRKQDEVARWGGDEFLIMLPETDQAGGQIVAEKIRAKILSTPFEYRSLVIPVTVTLGVGTSEVGTGVGSCIRKADQALHRGKLAGKNQVGILQERS